jgi:hypothetical protein
MLVALIVKLDKAAVLPKALFKMVLPPALLRLMLSQRGAAPLLMVPLSKMVALALQELL